MGGGFGVALYLRTTSSPLSYTHTHTHSNVSLITAPPPPRWRRCRRLGAGTARLRQQALPHPAQGGKDDPPTKSKQSTCQINELNESTTKINTQTKTVALEERLQEWRDQYADDTGIDYWNVLNPDQVSVAKRKDAVRMPCVFEAVLSFCLTDLAHACTATAAGRPVGDRPHDDGGAGARPRLRQ